MQNVAELIMGLRNRPPQTKEDLDDYLRTYYGVYLASKPIEEENSSPLDFVWDAYSTALGLTKTPHYNILGLATRGGQKCVRKNTKVFLNSGVKEIQHVNRGELIAAYPSQSFIADKENNGLSEIWKLETYHGYAFEGTSNHRTAVFDNGIKYKELKDISQNDHVLVGSNLLFNQNDNIDLSNFHFEQPDNGFYRYNDIKIPEKMDFDLGYLLGLLTGDGCLTSNNTFTIDNQSLEVIQRFLQILKDKFNLKHAKIEKVKNHYRVQCNNKKIKEFFKYIGLTSAKSINKTIPSIVWTGTYDLISGFISGLFDTDGNIDIQDDRLRIRWGFGGEKLAKDLQILLINLGIKSHYSVLKTNYKNSLSYNNYIGGIFARKLLYIINSFHSEKIVRINKVKSIINNNIQGDCFPKVAVEKLLNDIKDYYFKNYRYNKQHALKDRTICLSYKNITREKLKRFLNRYEACKEIKSYKILHDLIYSGFFLDQVKEVKSTFEHDEVWDLSVGEDRQCFTANGILVHNTLSASTLEALLIQHDSRSLIHMAAIQAQANVGYDHFRKIISRKIMSGVVKDPTMKETRSIKRGNTLQICTATLESVNSKHGSLLQDELDLTPKKIFDESQGMLSAELGKMPLNICISSRKFAIGNVQRIINLSKENPNLWKIHKWGILEFTSKCLPDRHGEFGEEIYVDDENLIAISKDDYQKIPESSPQREKFNKNIGYKNCLSCGIFSFCKGRLPNQADNNPHLQPIEVTIQQFKKEDTLFFISQRLNRKPSRKGLVYPMFDEEIHVKTYGDMWEIFHGEPHPDLVKDQNGNSRRVDITLEELANAFIKAGCRIAIGVDFGFSVLAVAGLYFVDGSGRVYFVDELAREGLSDAELAQEINTRWGHYPVEIVYADPESPGGKKEIRKATGWLVTDKVDKSVDDGLSTARRFLRVPGTRETKFYVAPTCVVFREEIQTYHYKIDPKTDEPTEIVKKVNDHSLDQFRYLIHSMFGKSENSIGFSGSKDKNLPNKMIERAPTGEELLQMIGSGAQPTPVKNEEKIKGDGSFFWF